MWVANGLVAENVPGEVIGVGARKDHGIGIMRGAVVVPSGVKGDGLKDRGARRDVVAKEKKEQHARNVRRVRRVAGDGRREIETRIVPSNGMNDLPGRKRRR